MDELKRKAIQGIVNASISSFAEGLTERYSREVNDPNGVINSKKNNCFIAELGEEFMFYSAFVRSFDSSFGNILENMGNEIAKLSYEVKGKIESFILPDQITRMGYIIDNYKQHIKPDISHYDDYRTVIPKNITSYLRTHEVDNYFVDKANNVHFLIELKASGDLDNKKAQTEKLALLEEFFLVKNSLRDDDNAKVKILFGTAYNKYGEGKEWKQERVRQFFADEELLIGREYWNFVCNDANGFDIVFNQYKISAGLIRSSLMNIKEMYF